MEWSGDDFLQFGTSLVSYPTTLDARGGKFTATAIPPPPTPTHPLILQHYGDVRIISKL